jgi:hypothetical protein
MGETLEEWARELVSDWDYYTGCSLASEWQKIHGPLPDGCRLIPKQLFVLGGEFEYANLQLIEEVRGMKSRVFFAAKLAGLTDGAQVSFKLVD